MTMNLTFAKMILGLEAVLDADQINKAVSQKLRDKANRRNIAAKQAIIDARDFLFMVGFEEGGDGQSLPSHALGWYRQDKTRYCSESENETYLVTEFVNYQDRVLFVDFPRLLDAVLPEHVLLIPEAPENSAHTEDPQLDHTVYTGFKLPVGDLLADFRVLLSSCTEYRNFDKYLQSSVHGHHCPYCGGTRALHCSCGAVSCDDSGRELAKCGLCHASYDRTDVKPFGMMLRRKNQQAKIEQSYRHLPQPQRVLTR